MHGRGRGGGRGSGSSSGSRSNSSSGTVQLRPRNGGGRQVGIVDEGVAMLAAAADTTDSARCTSNTAIGASSSSSSSSSVAGVDQRDDPDEKQADDPIDDGGNVVRFRAGRRHAEGAARRVNTGRRCRCRRRRRQRRRRVVEQVEVQPKVGPRLAAKRQRQGGVRWPDGAVHQHGGAGAVAAALMCRSTGSRSATGRRCSVCRDSCFLCCCRPIDTCVVAITSSTSTTSTSTTGLGQRPPLDRHGRQPGRQRQQENRAGRCNSSSASRRSVSHQLTNG